jgi:signal transduction histidine kinase
MSAAASDSAAPAGSAWAGFRRSAIYMTVLCIAIAVMLTVMDRGGFKSKLIYSFSIGICCWLIIDGGRHALAALMNRLQIAKGQAAYRRTGFPGWGGLIALMLTGMVLGPILGTALADYLTGNGRLDLATHGAHGSQVTIVITILASVASLVILSSLERLSSARAQAEAAQRAAAENQLRLLESQLEPHMLFNTLANLRVLIALDPPKAQLMLDQLIGFLRGTLGASRVPEHALSVEFARLADYLALLKVRMGDRLQVSFDLPADLQDVPVAPLLLQPLVENCIKHGLEPNVNGGRIKVSARRDGGQLVLTVRDTGRGLSDAKSDGTRFGLQQVRDRLNALYNGTASFTLVNATDNEGGTIATIRMPIKTPRVSP